MKLHAAHMYSFQGETLSMDYAPDKLDNGVLLDYGVLDTANPRVSGLVVCSACRVLHGSVAHCQLLGHMRVQNG